MRRQRSKLSDDGPVAKVTPSPLEGVADGTVLAYTDGSSRNTTTREGAWAFHIVLVGDDDFEAKRWAYREPQTTNNEMELTAILAVLQFVRLTDHPLIIRSDSEYAVKALNVWMQGWREADWVNSTGKPVKNVDLLIHIERLMKLHAHHREVTLEHVKGHNGDVFNESADQLAGVSMRTKVSNWSPQDIENQ